MTPELWRSVTDLAATQHGLVATRQLTDLAIGRKSVERLVARGLLVRERRRVLGVAGVPPSPWRPIAAACLAVLGEGVASHRSAAVLHGLPGLVAEQPEVTLFNRSAPRLSGVRAHRAMLLVADDLTLVHGIPTTTGARTLVDLAASIDVVRLARLVDDAERLGVARAGDVAACLDRVGTSGRPGANRLRSVLSDRLSVESGLERAWLRRLHRAGLPAPVTQYQLVVDGAVLLIDFAWPAQRVGLEIDGWGPHRVRGAFDNDRRRDLLFRLARWTVLRATSRTDPSLLVRTLNQALTR